MPPRFHAPDLAADAAHVALDADESRHLSRVLRLRRGDEVEILDGRGRMVAARVTDADARSAMLEILGDVPAQPEVPIPLVVCPALLKGDAMDDVVRDATVMGATLIVPIATARTNVPAERLTSGRLHARWTRVAVAAAKQCGRARIPEITPVRSVSAIVDDDAWRTWDRRWLVEPSLAGVTTDRPRDAHEGGRSSPPGGHDVAAADGLVLAIGPEGGWTPEEVDAARTAGWHPWTLGPFTLRAEQMMLAALAIVRHTWRQHEATDA